MSEQWAVVKRKVFYCLVCLYTFQFASPDSHQQSEQKPSESSSATGHLAMQAKLKATHPKENSSPPLTNLSSFTNCDVPGGAVTLTMPTKKPHRP